MTFTGQLILNKIEEEHKEKEELIRQQNEEKKRQLIEWQKQNEQSYDYKKYNSRYITKVIEGELDRQEEEEQKAEFRKSLHHKMRSYNETVKKKYGPVVSRTKKEEVERRKQSLEIPAKEKYKPGNDIMSDQEKRKQIYEERMIAYQKYQKKQASTPSISTQQQLASSKRGVSLYRNLS